MSSLLKFIVVSSLLSTAFSQATAPEWGICGGRNWTGPTKCPAGWTCTVDNEYYSHCYKSAVVKTTTKTTTTPKSTTKSATTSTKKVSSITAGKTTTLISITTKPSTTTSAIPSGSVAPEWGHCGGLGFTEPIRCPPGFICVKVNDNFSQCLPDPSVTTTKSSTPVITTSATPSSSVAPAWGHCGGLGFTEPIRCPSGFTCVKVNDNFSQCLPDPSVTTTKSSTPVITASATPSGPVVAEWGQCGGQGFTGPTRCSFAFMCVKSNDFFSQCLPDPSVSTTKRTTASRPTTTEIIPIPTFAYMFVFGDSYSKTGFDITGTKPSPANELGNPAPPGNTTSGGRNWVSYTTSSSEILAYNFASEGAVTDSALVTTSNTNALSFVDQVALFKANLFPAPAYAPWTSVNSLFVVWIGINDVASSFNLPDWETKSQQIVDRYFTQVQALYDAGARKFAFFTVPSIYKTPLMLAKSQAIQNQLATAVSHFNALLTAGRNAFVTTNPGMTSFYTQVMTTSIYFDIILENPTQHGAPDATCTNSDGRSCLWWDDFHPGMSIQQNIQGMLSNIGAGIWTCCGNTGL